MLFSTFHLYAVLKLAVFLAQNRKESKWCPSSAALPKNEYGSPHFLFYDYNKNSAWSVRRWMKNRIKSNSGRYHRLHGKKIAPICLVLCCAQFLPKEQYLSALYRENEHEDLHYYVFIMFLTCYNSNPSFTENLLMSGSFTRKSPEDFFMYFDAYISCRSLSFAINDLWDM